MANRRANIEGAQHEITVAVTNRIAAIGVDASDGTAADRRHRLKSVGTERFERDALPMLPDLQRVALRMTRNNALAEAVSGSEEPGEHAIFAGERSGV